MRLAKKPEDRYNTVNEFLSAWKRALEEAKSPHVEVPTVRMEDPKQTVQPLGTPQATNIQQGVSTPKAAPKSQNWLGWAAGCLVGLCLLLVIGGGGMYLINSGVFADTPPSPTPAPTQTEAPQPTATTIPITRETLLEDDFSDDSIWGLLDDSTASIEYDNDRLRLKVFKNNWIVWSTPNGEFYENIHTEVTV